MPSRYHVFGTLSRYLIITARISVGIFHQPVRSHYLIYRILFLRLFHHLQALYRSSADRVSLRLTPIYGHYCCTDPLTHR